MIYSFLFVFFLSLNIRFHKCVIITKYSHTRQGGNLRQALDPVRARKAQESRITQRAQPAEVGRRGKAAQVRAGGFGLLQATRFPNPSNGNSTCHPSKDTLPYYAVQHYCAAHLFDGVFGRQHAKGGCKHHHEHDCKETDEYGDGEVAKVQDCCTVE